jgi:thioredoxin-related protein
MKIWNFKISLIFVILSWLSTSPAWAVERGVLPMASDLSKLAQEAKEKRAPILILFSSAGCHYCGQVRSEFLIPTTLNADYDNKVIMVEIEAGSSMRLVDFDGQPTAHGEFAARYQVHMTPTVKLLDAQGREAAIPLVGIVSRDYYGGFLDQAIDAALAKIRGAANTAVNP